MSRKIDAAAEAMEIRPNHTLWAPPPEDGGKHRHTHVAIEWAGGVIWLDMSEQHDHFCIDVRNFVEPHADLPAPAQYADQKYSTDCNLAGTGVFTIVNGRRQSLGEAHIARTEMVELAERIACVHDDQGAWPTDAEELAKLVLEDQTGGDYLKYKARPLTDPDGTLVEGHGWNGGYVITLMHGKKLGENQTNRPAGPGRG